MIRKLRWKFVAVCMGLVALVLSAVFGAAYHAVRQNIEDLSRQMLYQVLREDSGRGAVPNPTIEIGGDRVLLPYFTVNIWGDTAYITGGTYADLENTDTLRDILSQCLEQGAAEGTVSEYHLRYLSMDNGLYRKLAFVDMSMEQAVLRRLVRSYLLIALGAMLVLLGIAAAASRWVTRPVEKAWKQQRQFLSDASHELKTPLTVILSNAELLEGAGLAEKPARWSGNIHTEAEQMRTLVEQMLTLARADNGVRPAAMEPLNLSDVATDCVLAFEPVAFEAGKPLEERIAADITVVGDADRLRRLISILLDNAVKYGAEGGHITLTLEKTDRQARLTVSNPGDPIPPEHLAHLFERSMEQAVLRRLVRSYLLIALGAMLVLLGIAAAASRWVTRPVEKAWKQQRQFLSDASHELKTPLTVILSNAELLEGAGLAEKPARWSGNIHTEAEQMRTLVEQMLTLARADNGVRPAAMEPLNLSDVATDCVLAFEPVAFEAGKPLEERIAADITVVGDADRLRRLISILLDNAVKYGAEGGHITLTLEKMDRQAQLTVSNPGDPIPPEHLAHLFERFYRADASRGEKSGFGLGLAIADTIAREHKGALKAESDAASTRFTFTMPLRKQA